MRLTGLASGAHPTEEIEEAHVTPLWELGREHHVCP
jgi:hypothetical protein